MASKGVTYGCYLLRLGWARGWAGSLLGRAPSGPATTQGQRTSFTTLLLVVFAVAFLKAFINFIGFTCEKNLSKTET